MAFHYNYNNNWKHGNLFMIRLFWTVRKYKSISWTQPAKRIMRPSETTTFVVERVFYAYFPSRTMKVFKPHKNLGIIILYWTLHIGHKTEAIVENNLQYKTINRFN